MLFELQGFTKEFISLEIDQLGVEYQGKANFKRNIFRYYILSWCLGKRDLLEYQIQDERLFIDNSNEGSRAEVKVVFRRSDVYQIWLFLYRSDI